MSATQKAPTTTSIGIFLGLIIGMMIMAVDAVQKTWSSISGLYFPNAGTAVNIIYTFYFLFSLYQWSINKKVNRTKLVLMYASLLLIFSPALHLVISEQISVTILTQEEFNPSLEHIKGAAILPYVALLAVLIPYNDFSRKLFKN